MLYKFNAKYSIRGQGDLFLWTFDHGVYLHNNASESESVLIKSCYDSAHICPLRAEISPHEYWETVLILIFVWLVVIGFRQNYFHILLNFGDFGAKMSFFCYIINQKRKIFIKHCSPPCSKTPLISEMCIYITNNLCKWGLGTRGGTMFYRLKMGEDLLTAHEIPL